MKNNIWITRNQEKFITDWIKNKHTLFLPIVGQGTVGKTSLLKKIKSISKRKNTPYVFTDPSKFIHKIGYNTLDFLLYSARKKTQISLTSKVFT